MQTAMKSYWIDEENQAPIMFSMVLSTLIRCWKNDGTSSNQNHIFWAGFSLSLAVPAGFLPSINPIKPVKNNPNFGLL